MAGSRRLERISRTVLDAYRSPGGHLVVALSGGADSAVCAWAALRSGSPVRAIHVDHGLAGSPVMRRAAIMVAGRLGIDLEILEVEVDSGSSPEQQARRARYEALSAALATDETALLGHTADDQVETFLINLLRGSGIEGLSGMPQTRGPYARPMLGVWRDDARELATLLGLPWRDDPANLEPGYLRNRIRRRLIPQLESEYNPALSRAIHGSVVHLARIRDLLVENLDTTPIQVSSGRVRIPAGVLAGVRPLIASQLVRQMFLALDPAHPPLERSVSAVIDVASFRAPSAMVEGGRLVERHGPFVAITETPAAAIQGAITVTVPGAAEWLDWSLELVVSGEAPPTPLSPYEIVLGTDAESVVIRGAERRDRIAIVGGSKPVFEALAESGVPPSLRDRYPIVLINGEVVWIPGVRRAVWAPSTAERYLCAIAIEEHQWDK